MTLERENGATGCFAGFQGTMRFLNLGQGKSLIDVNFHLATLYHSKQIVGHGLRAFARGDVAEQGLARDIQRTFDTQNTRCKWWYGTRRIAESCHQSERTQAIERFVPGVFAH